MAKIPLRDSAVIVTWIPRQPDCEHQMLTYVLSLCAYDYRFRSDSHVCRRSPYQSAKTGDLQVKITLIAEAMVLSVYLEALELTTRHGHHDSRPALTRSGAFGQFWQLESPNRMCGAN